MRAWRVKNREYVRLKKRAWAASNKQHVLAYEREYYANNSPVIRARQKDYQLRNLPGFAVRNKKWSDKFPEKCLLKAAKSRAKKNGLPFNIDVTDIVIPEFCPILGIKLVRSTTGWMPDTPSLDKVLPHLGYVKGNVQVISGKANLMKNNATPGELQAFANWVIQQNFD